MGGSLFSVGQTLNPLVGKAPSELNSAHDTIIVHLLVLQCVWWDFKENMCFGGYGANTVSIHMAEDRGSPERVWTSARGMRTSHQRALPQHPLQNIRSILRAQATSGKSLNRWTLVSSFFCFFCDWAKEGFQRHQYQTWEKTLKARQFSKYTLQKTPFGSNFQHLDCYCALLNVLMVMLLVKKQCLKTLLAFFSFFTTFFFFAILHKCKWGKHKKTAYEQSRNNQ